MPPGYYASGALDNTGELLFVFSRVQQIMMSVRMPFYPNFKPVGLFKNPPSHPYFDDRATLVDSKGNVYWASYAGAQYIITPYLSSATPDGKAFNWDQQLF